MRSKNSKSHSRAESAHIGRIKKMNCGVCDASGPSDAHHIKQGQHFTVIPLCKDCHQGSFNGIHGQARVWSVVKATELSVLNDTIGRLHA
jgi:hypothetical protein